MTRFRFNPSVDALIAYGTTYTVCILAIGFIVGQAFS